MPHFVYILQCSDNSYYVGSTVNLDQRLWQHQQGEGAKYTARRLPVELIYSEEFSRIDEAYRREKQIQGWSRAKREALIRGDFDDVSLHDLIVGYDNDDIVCGSNLGSPKAYLHHIAPGAQALDFDPVSYSKGLVEHNHDAADHVGEGILGGQRECQATHT